MGFRKVDPDRWEFSGEGFMRGQKHLLKTIKRRKGQSTGPCVEGEMEALKRENHTLMAELRSLKQQQHGTRAHLLAMEQRLQVSELRQKQMMGFFARAMQNHGLIRRKEKRSVKNGSGGVKMVIAEVGVVPGELQVSELEALAMEMQKSRAERKKEDEEDEVKGDDDMEWYGEGSWEELMNQQEVGGGVENKRRKKMIKKFL